MTLTIRSVARGDAAAIAAIYAPYVTGSAITFEETAPDTVAMADRIAQITATHPWLVAERDGAVLGYAYGYPYRVRAAYRWACEVAIYVAQDARGHGIGAPLYAALMTALTEAGYVTAIGAIAVPNPASEALHAKLGFRHAGTQRGIGFKHGRWHDVAFWQRDLAPRGDTPAPPQPR